MGNDPLQRRDVLQIAAAFAGTSIFSPVQRALAQSSLRRTPDQVLGPFYPVGKVAEMTGNMVQPSGKAERAQGQVLNVMGRVLNMKGEAISDAKLEIWQANAQGRYRHPGDTNPAPLDPNFEGFAVLKTDTAGRYRFKTIKPGPYPSPLGMRTPHIHVRLCGREDELVTQLYFEGEPLNEQDRFLQSVPEPARSLLIAKMLPPTPEFEPDSRMLIFDVVTLRG